MIQDEIFNWPRAHATQLIRPKIYLSWISAYTVTGQNGTDKMVSTKWYTDKMVWTKWYGQNGTDKMVASFGIDYNSSEINTYLETQSHK